MLKGRYPQPIVDEHVARKMAQGKIWAVRREHGYREVADAIQLKHGSRKSGMPQHERRVEAARRKQKVVRGNQLSLLAGTNSPSLFGFSGSDVIRFAALVESTRSAVSAFLSWRI